MPQFVIRKLAKIAVCVASVAMSSTLYAAPNSDQAPNSAVEPNFEITPFIGHRAGGRFKSGPTQSVPDEDLSVSGSSSAAVALDWQATENGTQYELLYSRQNSKIDDSTPVDLKIEYLQLGGTAIIGDADSRVVPFAAGGFGAARFSPDSGSYSQETRWAVNLGGGVRVPLTKHVRLRFEVRGYLTWVDSKSSLFCSSAGTATCAIVARGDTFFQYEALGGVSIGF